jgi:hypothetical protein
MHHANLDGKKFGNENDVSKHFWTTGQTKRNGVSKGKNKNP